MGIFGRTMPNGDAKMLLDAEVRGCKPSKSVDRCLDTLDVT